MSAIAHVAGLPLEELALALGGASGGLVFARGWLTRHLRHREEPAK